MKLDPERKISVKLWLVQGSTSLKAKADITLQLEDGEITLRGFRVVQVCGKGPFVAAPQERYKNKEVKDTYKAIILMSRSLEALLYPIVLEDFKRQVQGKLAAK